MVSQPRHLRVFSHVHRDLDLHVGALSAALFDDLRPRLWSSQTPSTNCHGSSYALVGIDAGQFLVRCQDLLVLLESLLGHTSAALPIGLDGFWIRESMGRSDYAG